MGGGGGGGPAKKSGSGLAIGGEMGAFAPKPKKHESSSVDMTAMIDLVFMMNIFFMVTSLVTRAAQMELPPAQHVSPVDMEQSLVLVIVPKDKGGTTVFLGDEDGEQISDTGQEERIASEAAEAVRQGKKYVVIKADKMVTNGESSRIAAAAASVEGLQLHYAVQESSSGHE